MNKAMEQIRETEKLYLFEKRLKNSVQRYRQHKEREPKPVLIYKINKKGIEYYLSENKIVFLNNLKEIPDYVNRYGYGFQNRVINNFLKYSLPESIKKIVVSEKITTSYENTTLNLNELDIIDLAGQINQEDYASRQTQKMFISNFFATNIPSLNFEYYETNNNKRLILRNLNDGLLEQLNADEVEQFGAFYVKATKKYTRADFRKRMVLGLQKNAQLITLQEVIKRYENLLTEKSAESKWQAFFDEYITLFDNRYVQKLDYKNIATGITKYPDLVLVDIYGYVDFYELKRNTTKLLKYDKSHKTYYWSDDISKVIGQVSNYLQKAKENCSSYTKTIKEENNLSVNLVRPKAFVVAGVSKELDDEKKQNHFKNLRESLKDIEFVLYDELLDRIKNLVGKIEFTQDKRKRK